MTLPPGYWPRLKDVFAGARALPADARTAYLKEACGGDQALHQEVESLLAADARAKSFLEAPGQFDDTHATENLEGRRIGRYQFATRIGAGGMGEVYRACDTNLNRQVAIKVLLPAVADDPDRLARFGREAQVLASLNHPHIAQIHGLEDADGVRALVMELVEGPTLAERIAQGAIPVSEALPMARQIAEALEALSAFDVRQCRVVELRFFAGLTIDEAAEALDIPPATVEREWALAKAWLYRRLTRG